MSIHPQFEATPIENRWTRGSLRALFETLEKEAKQVPGKTRWRCLPSGAMVSMKIRGDSTHELKIIRAEAPKDPVTGPEKFKAEVDTFVKHFAIAHYIRGPHPSDPRVGIGVILVEPKVLSGHYVWCVGCGSELVSRDDNFPIDGQQCTPCAFASGREHTAEVKRRIAAEQVDLIPHGMADDK